MQKNERNPRYQVFMDKEVCMEIIYEQPEGYMDGAYRVIAKLPSEKTEIYKKYPLAFKIPSLPKRFIHTENEYVVACTDEEGTSLRGRFKNDQWVTHVYSNGIEESKNPTPISSVIEAIESEINAVLKNLDDLCITNN